VGQRGPMRSIPFQAPRQIFRHIDALEAGWTSDALVHAVERGRLVRLRRGIYRVAGHDPTDRNQLARDEHVAQTISVLLRNPRAVASHASAALLWGLPILTIPARPCVTLAPGRSGSLTGAHLYRAVLPEHDLAACEHDPRVRLTTVGRTVADVARADGVAAGLVVGDAALYRELTDERGLAAAVHSCARWPGARSAAAMLPLLDSGSESPLETRSRFCLHEQGVEAPELQTVIHDAAGHVLARVDFYWHEFGVVGEADGRDKYDAGFARVAEEKRRQERLEETGLVVVRWGSKDLAEPAALVARLRSAFARGVHKPADERLWTARLRPRFVVPGQ
jgi:hypothetical protein